MSYLEQVELDLLVLRSYKKVYCCILQMCKRILQFKNRSESTERFRLTQVRMELHAQQDLILPRKRMNFRTTSEESARGAKLSDESRIKSRTR